MDPQTTAEIQPLYYLTHPAVEQPGNALMRGQALSYLGAMHRIGLCVIAPWIALGEAIPNPDSYDSEHVLETFLRAIQRSDGVIAVGFGWTRAMRFDADEAAEHELRLVDATGDAPVRAALVAKATLDG